MWEGVRKHTRSEDTCKKGYGIFRRNGEDCEAISYWIDLSFDFDCFALFVCFVILGFDFIDMRASWRILGMYCRKIELLDWNASCML